MIGMIAAVELSGLIGYDNKLPFNNSTDLKRFKSVTMGSTLIMGRKTWESLPKKELPGRVIHVLHRNASGYENTDNVLHFDWFEDAIIKANTKDIWIAGGRQIYQEAILMNIPEIIDLTIHNHVFLPPIQDGLRAVKEKCVYLPEISYFYSIESENVNENDPTLVHRKYLLRDAKKWGTDWEQRKLITLWHEHVRNTLHSFNFEEWSNKYKNGDLNE